MAFEDGDFPDWFLIEVLSRLPAKFVFRFKCVSPKWLSVVSHPSFARLYSSRASLVSQPQPWTIVSSPLHAMPDISDQKLFEDVYSEYPKCPEFCVLPLPSSQLEHDYKIISVNHGLVLYGCHLDSVNHHYGSEYSICNPITKQWFDLPRLERCFNWFSVGFVTRVERGILTSFKVVRLQHYEGNANALKFDIFSSETGEWVNFTIQNEYAINIAARRTPVSFRENLHWVENERGILGYDPYNKPEKCRIIELPADITKEYNNSTYVGLPSLCDVHREHLKYFEVSGMLQSLQGFSGLRIWVLDDYSTGRWSLQHRIMHHDILFVDPLFGHRLVPIPVSFHPFEADIVYLVWQNGSFSYNFQTRRLEPLGLPVNYLHLFEKAGNIMNRGSLCWWKTFPLAFPPWPTSIPLPNQQANDS